MLSKPTTIFNCLKGILVAQQVRFVLLTLVVLLAVNGVRHNAGVAHAGAIARSCKDLIVFAGANVNNYVKQFAGVTDPDLPLGQAGKMMALLIQLDGLYSQIGYGPLGYVYIKTADGNPEECLNELIIKRLLGEECCSSSLLGKGRSAILLSGHFQRVKDQIYLLTSVEFFRNGIDEIVSIPSREAGDGKISFVANLPDTAVSFAPRKFTKKQLDRVAHYYSDVMDVREEPDVNLKAKKIDPFAIDGFSYYIEEKRSDDWLKIKSFKHGLPSGWVRVPDDIGGRGLRDLLPELYFMEATALYLQTRIRRKSQPVYRATDCFLRKGISVIY